MSEIEINAEMKEKIKEYKQYFYDRTFSGHIINYLNGFKGVGILITPEDHLTKKINTIWYLEISFNKLGTDIEEIANIEMDLEEAEDLIKTLKKGVKKYKKYSKELIRYNLKMV